MTAALAERKWIDDVELADVQIKWGFSNFAGRQNDYNSEGDHNFTVILPEATAMKLMEDGWAVKRYDPAEEGEPPEFTLKIKISYKFEDPKVYFLKSRTKRKYRAKENDLADITRASAQKINVVITPSRWVKGDRSGITAYAKNLQVYLNESRFDEEIEDFVDVSESQDFGGVDEDGDDFEPVSSAA